MPKQYDLRDINKYDKRSTFSTYTLIERLSMYSDRLKTLMSETKSSMSVVHYDHQKSMTMAKRIGIVPSGTPIQSTASMLRAIQWED